MKSTRSALIADNHRDVFVDAAAAEDRVLVTGTAFNTNTGRPELWLSVHLTTMTAVITAHVLYIHEIH